MKMAADHPPFHVACRNMFHLANNVIDPPEGASSVARCGGRHLIIYLCRIFHAISYIETECVYCRSMIAAGGVFYTAPLSMQHVIPLEEVCSPIVFLLLCSVGLSPISFSHGSTSLRAPDRERGMETRWFHRGFGAKPSSSLPRHLASASPESLI